MVKCHPMPDSSQCQKRYVKQFLRRPLVSTAGAYERRGEDLRILDGNSESTTPSRTELWHSCISRPAGDRAVNARCGLVSLADMGAVGDRDRCHFWNDD